MNEEVYRNKIYVSSPTSISIGHNTWFALDTKLVGRIKKLINDCEKKDKEIGRLNNIIDEFNEIVENTYNNINLGDESEDFMILFNKWQELISNNWKNYKLKKLKGSDKDE